MARERDKPTLANDADGSQIPSIETTPGIIPQTPQPEKAPSREQAKRTDEERTDEERERRSP